MKSRLISRVLDDPGSSAAKAFIRELADTLQLSEEDRRACLKVLPLIHLAEGKAETERLIEELVNDRQAGRDKVHHALGIMDFLLKAFLSRDVPDSDWEFWASDLEEAGHLSDSTCPVFEEMVASIRSDLATEVEPEVQRRRAAAGVLPAFGSCGVTVEVRSVREDFYRRGTPIGQFEPKVVDTTTVASIAITLDEGPFKDVYFQADESDVEYLINMFEAAKKEMAALRRFLKLKD
ncbi:MAG: hypothetical protein HQ567_17875 [Candidatus Nealsonbacteria bacterium]|nr:hypothetical protein [Candidatus Nealsonbacteria bacterium]